MLAIFASRFLQAGGLSTIVNVFTQIPTTNARGRGRHITRVPRPTFRPSGVVVPLTRTRTVSLPPQSIPTTLVITPLHIAAGILSMMVVIWYDHRPRTPATTQQVEPLRDEAAAWAQSVARLQPAARQDAELIALLRAMDVVVNGPAISADAIDTLAGRISAFVRELATRVPPEQQILQANTSLALMRTRVEELRKQLAADAARISALQAATRQVNEERVELYAQLRVPGGH